MLVITHNSMNLEKAKLNQDNAKTNQDFCAF